MNTHTITWSDRRLIDLLGITHPIIQAPMAGSSTPEMAAASAHAGALGSLGCAMMTGEAVTALSAKMAGLTNHGVNYNFFCHTPPVDNATANDTARQLLKPYFDGLELGEVPEAKASNFPFDQAMCDVMLAIKPKVVSFHFGLPDASMVDELKQAGIVVMSSATTAEEARYLEAHGADVIIAQGWEAGGHRGFFLSDHDKAVGTMALVPQVVDAVSVPVVAAGGIADGRGIAAALMLGAAGVQIGTAFLTCVETGVPPVHHAELMRSDGSDTQTTTVFSGRPARGITNRYMSELAKHQEQLPDFPIMNTLTGPLRKSSAASGSPDFVALWSGQAAALNREASVNDLVEKLVQETIDQFGSRGVSG